MKSEYINNWHRVWNNRKLTDTNKATILEKLISIDGFDSPLGMMSESDWKKYIKLVLERYNINKEDSIFEVGCGAGAFLYTLYESGHEVSGIDYSEELIKVAKSSMPLRESYFEHKEASKCKIDPPVSVAIANHVFHYFHSHAYASDVLKIMINGAAKKVLVKGIPDLSLKKESEIMRRGLLSPKEYELKYKGLDILYFEKSWFEKIGLENQFHTQFYDHQMPGFAQNPFRFDCLMTRKNPV